jgi:hypothetical protein
LIAVVDEHAHPVRVQASIRKRRAGEEQQD